MRKQRMGSEYFAQYLLNEGVLSQAQAEELLPKTREMDLAACLLDAGVADSAGLDALSGRYKQCGLHPVKRAVRRLSGERTDLEEAYYEEFMELFMEELMDFLKTPAVISLESVEKSAFSKMGKTHAASQRLTGDLSIVTGIIGRDSYFLELAKRYAQEEMDDIDDLAVDSIEEFLKCSTGPIWCGWPNAIWKRIWRLRAGAGMSCPTAAGSLPCGSVWTSGVSMRCLQRMNSYDQPLRYRRG